MGVGAPQARLSAIETGGACETFDDAFLRDWIGERLGRSEVRLVAVCVVRVGRCAESDAAYAERSRISAILAAENAVILEKGVARFVAAWGLAGLGGEDVCASIAAVERLVGENSPDAGMVAALDICELTVDWRASDIEPEDLGARIGHRCHHLNEAVARAVDGKSRLLLTSRFAGACLYGQQLPAVANEPLVRGRAEATRPIWLEIPLDDRRIRPSVRLSGRLAAQSVLDELGDLKPLVRAAASAGGAFSANALGEMLAISAGRLVGGLEALLRRDVLEVVPQTDRNKRRQRTRAASQRSVLPIKADTLLRFVSDAIQRAAYQSVGELKRRQFHAHAAAIRVSPGGQSPAVEPEAIARHYRAASNVRQSKRWFSKAAWQAIAQGDYADAVDYLRTALDECRDEAFSPAFERSLLQLLGVQLAIVEGNGSDAVFDAYLRSIDATDGDQPVPYGQEFRSLWLAQSCHLVKGDIRGALTAGKHLELRLKRDMAGATRRSLGMRLLVKRLNGLTLMLAGNIAGARHDYSCVLADYDPDRHAVLRLSYGSDQRCLALAHLAWLSGLCAPSGIGPCGPRKCPRGMRGAQSFAYLRP